MTQGRNTYYIASANGNALCKFPLVNQYIGFLSSLFRLLPPPPANNIYKH